MLPPIADATIAPIPVEETSHHPVLRVPLEEGDGRLDGIRQPHRSRRARNREANDPTQRTTHGAPETANGAREALPRVRAASHGTAVAEPRMERMGGKIHPTLDAFADVRRADGSQPREQNDAVRVCAQPRGSRQRAKRSVPPAHLPPAPHPQLGGEEESRELIRGADVLHPFLRHDGVAQHLPPRASVALESVRRRGVEPLRQRVLDGRPGQAEGVAAHPAPALHATRAAHADPLPLAKAPGVDPPLGPGASTRRDEHAVARRALLLAAEAEPARPLLRVVGDDDGVVRRFRVVWRFMVVRRFRVVRRRRTRHRALLRRALL
mmetsp:Transcript_2864/g.11301  ORF Transcript_2864/g.11301 Transcript_2864/m.11301 type:complete len:323 (-) Transcript_2864:968-1936(-)